ncbi:MAG TPA: alpha/beta hydrolase [Candidatus Dormibacteraeota bacterium]|nr:alpha/beta hydrolase [Candidatus Dormibacteraeota bacterium]
MGRWQRKQTQEGVIAAPPTRARSAGGADLPTGWGGQGSEFDLELPSGRLHAQRFGSPEAPLALCIPGLSANLKSFDFICERIAGDRLQVVALDLRGRGNSEVTAAGTYGWANHARDAFAASDALGANRFSLIGHSMGGAVAMAAAAQDAARLERIVLIDFCGAPDAASLGPILVSVNRLGTVFPSMEFYIEAVKALRLIEPWSGYWERYFRYELEPVEGGVRTRTVRGAVLEDYAYGGTQEADTLWSSLTMPVLLLRASREIMPGMGYIVSDADRSRFPLAVPTASVVDVDANHYTVVTSDESVAAIRRFFGPN